MLGRRRENAVKPASDGVRMVALRTFGGLSIEANGAPPTGAAAQRQTLALLALLARHPRGLSRGKPITHPLPETDASHRRGQVNRAPKPPPPGPHADKL